MNLAPLIEHTVLSVDTNSSQIQQLCNECITYNLGAVCVPPYFVNEATKLLAESDAKVVTVVGFPMGYTATPAKVLEIAKAFDDGADEIDAVINLAALKNANWAFVRNDIDSMTRAVHMRGKPIKVIIEMGMLTDDELKRICDICSEIEVDYVKTSTGYHGMPPTTADMIETLAGLVDEKIKIKASGGIRTHDQAVHLVEKGASRLGSSNGMQLLG